ncbi:MAG: CDP-diacylglycerol--glycerol-3-phosphate 3-phosphatidyltransferase [Endomicrobium sp.]|jgi:CDP-diacylglycerol--glycerol-3-phosphate 3-phosphatidyltransferase|nr:CDP-diacylglycerol--glycerol-3-phosphate 3-phosphatidyltransferase [Endomicrobium sp.]
MNFANKLTIARICMVPFFILFIELGGFYNNVLALAVFCAASITDMLDGQIARRNKTVTSLGIFLDPIADKMLISAAFIYFVNIPMLGITAWMVIIIIAREFIITGLRSIAAVRNVMIPADKSGKFKTVSQIIVIIVTMVILIVREALFEFAGLTLDALRLYDFGSYASLSLMMEKMPFWTTLVVVMLTVYSGVNYILRYRTLFSEN